MNKQKSIPSLRFPDFIDVWRINKLKELTNYVDYRGKTPPKSDKGIFLVTAKNIKQGFIDYDSSKEYILESDYSEVMRRGRPLIGDVLITTEAPLGNIATIDREDIALAQRVIKLRGKQDITNNTFLKYRLISPYFKKKLHDKASGSTAKGIKGSELHIIPITIPSIIEQQKIATFLSAVDDKLTQLKKEKTLLEQYKKGVMQKIFSQEIRFKDENGKEFPKWEEKKLGEVAKFLKGKGLSKNDISENGKTECIRYGELYTQYKEVITKIYSRTNLHTDELVLSDINDVIIPASGETQIDIATASCIMKKGIALGGDLNIIRTNNNGVFLSYYLNNIKKLDIARLSQGISVVHLYSSQLALLNLELPCVKEQTKIANFLSAIDDKISLVNAQIEKTEIWKKGLLQKMFC